MSYQIKKPHQHHMVLGAWSYETCMKHRFLDLLVLLKVRRRLAVKIHQCWPSCMTNDFTTIQRGILDCRSPISNLEQSSLIQQHFADWYRSRHKRWRLHNPCLRRLLALPSSQSQGEQEMARPASSGLSSISTLHGRHQDS
jgi:hypothetical protein